MWGRASTPVGWNEARHSNCRTTVSDPHQLQVGHNANEVGGEMRTALRVLSTMLLILAAFALVMYVFVYTIFRFSLGHISSDVFYACSTVLFLCTEFLVNVAWRAIWNRFFSRLHS